jgi:hypothetical protein
LAEETEMKRPAERSKIDRDNIKIYLKEIGLERNEVWVLANTVIKLRVT